MNQLAHLHTAASPSGGGGGRSSRMTSDLDEMATELVAGIDTDDDGHFFDDDDDDDDSFDTEDSDDDSTTLSYDLVEFSPADTPSCLTQVVVSLRPSTYKISKRERLGLPEEKCSGLLVKDDLILSSAYCAAQARTVEIPHAKNKTAAHIATHYVGPHAIGIVRVDLPNHHHNSGIPRKRLFLGSNPSKGPPRLYCRDGRPVASALPLNTTTWVPLSPLRPYLGDVFWDDDLDSTAELTNGIRRWYTTKQSNTTLVKAIDDLRYKWLGGPGSVDIYHPDNYGPLLEAEDPRGNRYHMCFGLWWTHWLHEKPFSGIPFFDWLDFGPGRTALPIDPIRGNVDPGVYKDNDWKWLHTCVKSHFNNKKIRYFTEEESAQYAVDLKPYKDGRMVRMTYHESGKPVENPEKDLLWVWGLDRTLYVVEDGHQIGHTSLIASRPALAAGEMDTGGNGRLEEVDFGSGHYKPNTDNFIEFYNWMLDKGLNVSSIHWELRSKWNVTKQSLRKALNSGRKITRESVVNVEME